MIKEVETEKGSVVLDPDWEDCVPYLMKNGYVDDKIRNFDKDLRQKIWWIIYDVIKDIVADYDLNERIEEEDGFWEWYLEQQED